MMIFQFKVELKDIQPPIWRRFETSSGITFHQLHKILQIVMGWQDSHLYEFDFGQKSISLPDAEFASEERKELSSRREMLEAHFRTEGQAVDYIYDFGDYWVHQLTLEGIKNESEGSFLLCTGGERNCPPEDCGGISGYKEILRIISNPLDPEYESILEWLGDEFDPDYFDLEAVNDELNRKKGALGPKPVKEKSETQKRVKLTKARLKKWMQSLSQQQLMDLLTECFAMNKEAEQLLTVRCLGEAAIHDLFLTYQKKIEDEFFPDRGQPKLRLSEIKKDIVNFEKITESPRHSFELRLLFVEMGVEFTRTYGDIDARFYNTILSMFESLILRVNEEDGYALFDAFKDRIHAVVENSEGIGWGFHDGLDELYEHIRWI
jgi:hypothetical protein